MKKIILISIFSILIIGCSNSKTPNKNFNISSAEIKNVSKIMNSSEGAFYYPRFGLKGEKVFLTNVDYSGIFYFDTKLKSINTLIDAKGTGLNYIQKENDVYFVLPAISERTNRRVYSLAKLNIDSKKIDIIYTSNHGIKSINAFTETLSFFVNDSVKFYDFVNKKFIDKVEYPEVSVYSFNKDEVIIFRNGELKKFIPFENYMISNLKEIDDTNLLIEIAGKGIYKLSLESYETEFLTDEIVYLDVLKNSNLAVGMKQENDGLKETKSEIFLFDLDKKELRNITQSFNTTALNPSFSRDGLKIVFNTLEGDIYLMSLKISEGQAL